MKLTSHFQPLFLVFTLTLLGITACSSKPQQSCQNLADLGVDAQSVNNQIILTEPAEIQNSHINKEPQGLILKSLTKDSYIFPSDYGIQLFTYADGKWTQVENSIKFYGNNDQILAYSEDYPSRLTIVFSTDLQPFDHPVEITVLVVGHVLLDNQQFGDPVVACYEMEISP
jgi:hypothetical protein